MMKNHHLSIVSAPFLLHDFHHRRRHLLHLLNLPQLRDLRLCFIIVILCIFTSFNLSSSTGFSRTTAWIQRREREGCLKLRKIHRPTRERLKSLEI
ncbi:hypothetical protein Sjap_024096 [Stephania japonica]|uniref:Transmembrane protein n=1 Tax=Stephania japonica TaxID=461633 RepID=A0AAP0ECY6_9MAGN